MDKLTDSVQFAVICYFFLKEILYCFYVMVGGTFDFFNAAGIVYRKFCHNAVEQFMRLRRKVRDFGDTVQLGQFL